MPRSCTVCAHPERAASDKALVSGETVRALASRYVPLRRSAVQRHKEGCLPAVVVQAAEQTGIAHALDVVQQLKAINAASLQVLQAARANGQGGLALAAVDRIQRQ